MEVINNSRFPPNRAGRRRRVATAFCIYTVLLVFTIGDALAQFPGGGGRDFGRGGEGRGGDRRGGRGFDRDQFVRGLDSNENGLLEPDEIPQDGRRFFLEPAARAAGIDLNEPVPIEKLSEAMQAARERFSRGGMGGRPGGGDNGRGGGDRFRGGEFDRGGPGGPGGPPVGEKPAGPGPSTPKPALVAGFGGQSVAVQPLGFASTSQSTTSNGAGLSPSPANAGLPPAGNGGGGAIAQGPRGMALAMIKQKDKDGDGVLEAAKDERLNTIRDADANNDGKITVEELAAKLGDYAGKTGSDASSAPTTVYVSHSPAAPSAGSESSGGRRSYRFRTARERLPGDIPSWFTRSDENGDGQVAMSEYASTWTESKVNEFAKYDLNGDGVITAKECLKAERN